jgi:hypothetical protein
MPPPFGVQTFPTFITTYINHDFKQEKKATGDNWDALNLEKIAHSLH